EIVRIYGRRWDIEVFFRTAKQHLELERGCQGPANILNKILETVQTNMDNFAGKNSFIVNKNIQLVVSD
ncbi:transposase, partial [Desulfoplanes formicivorans]|uniref:transposase n=1 Tax=Desulfoplanes formicivorans TaxID=1592317 RepID=UPI00114CDF49